MICKNNQPEENYGFLQSDYYTSLKTSQVRRHWTAESIIYKNPVTLYSQHLTVDIIITMF